MKEQILPYTQMEPGAVNIYKDYGFTVVRTKYGFYVHPYDAKRGTLPEREITVDAENAKISLRHGIGRRTGVDFESFGYSLELEDSFSEVSHLGNLYPKEIGLIFCVADDDLRSKLRKSYKNTLTARLKKELDELKKIREHISSMHEVVLPHSCSSL